MKHPYFTANDITYLIEIEVYEGEVNQKKNNQGFKYFLRGVEDVCRTDDIRTVQLWLSKELMGG